MNRKSILSFLLCAALLSNVALATGDSLTNPLEGPVGAMEDSVPPVAETPDSSEKAPLVQELSIIPVLKDSEVVNPNPVTEERDEVLPASLEETTNQQLISSESTVKTTEDMPPPTVAIIPTLPQTPFKPELKEEVLQPIPPAVPAPAPEPVYEKVSVPLDHPERADRNGVLTISKIQPIDFIFPATIQGSSVTRIGEGAFQGCEYFKSVTIPASITEIGANAFAQCPNLKTIILEGRANTENLTLGTNWSGSAKIIFGLEVVEVEVPQPIEPVAPQPQESQLPVEETLTGADAESNPPQNVVPPVVEETPPVPDAPVTPETPADPMLQNPEGEEGGIINLPDDSQSLIPDPPGPAEDPPVPVPSEVPSENPAPLPIDTSTPSVPNEPIPDPVIPQDSMTDSTLSDETPVQTVA